MNDNDRSRPLTLGVLGAARWARCSPGSPSPPATGCWSPAPATPRRSPSPSRCSPGAEATTAVDAAANADIVLLALPLGKYRSVPVDAARQARRRRHELLVGDRRNPRRPHRPAFLVERVRPGVPVRVARRQGVQPHGLSRPRGRGTAGGTAGRKAIAIAGDDTTDLTAVATLVDALGFDPVVAGPLGEGYGSNPAASCSAPTCTPTRCGRCSTASASPSVDG
ncbi:NADP oxidoreductase [Micromonospora sp. M12]